MASTSYTTLPSSSYVGLGSQGDLFHSANYGTYDTGVGSLVSNPYEYQGINYGTHFTDNHQPSSYSNDYLRSTYANGGYSTQEPQPYSSDRYVKQTTFNQDPTINDYNNDGNTIQPPHKTTVDNPHVESNNQHQNSHADTTEHHPPVSTNNQSRERSQTNRVPSEPNTSNQLPPPPPAKQRNQSQPPAQSNQARSEQQNSKQPPPARRRSPSNSGNNVPSTTIAKPTNPPAEMKTTKSTQMRAAAIKKKEDTLEQKRKNGNFPTTKTKASPPKSQQQPQTDDEQSDKIKSKQNKKQPHSIHPQTDDEQNDKTKFKQNKKHPHSVPKQHKSRRDDYQSEDNNSSADEDTKDQHYQNKSKKRAAFSDTHQERYPPLPPVRRGRGPPFYDPAYDYPYPSGHPLRGQYPYYDDYVPYPPHYRHRHAYEDGYDAPPYVTAHRDPYDGFFDYEKRKSKSKLKQHKDKKEVTSDHEDRDRVTGNETEHEDERKNSHTKKHKNHKHSNKDDENDNEENTHPHYPTKYYDGPCYDDRYLLEVWRQERNDYLKNKFKPTIHDVLYSQQWLKSDSYLENQRRRTLRDTQGYYFPYKKYTLKDYKDLQKSESQYNPYSTINETALDRKERAKKRQEYASNIIERHIAPTFGGQQKTPRDMPPRKPWHLSHGEANDPEKLSKRERALEYAKDQLVKHPPQKAPRNQRIESDPTEKFVDSLFPQRNNDSSDDDSDH